MPTTADAKQRRRAKLKDRRAWLDSIPIRVEQPVPEWPFPDAARRPGIATFFHGPEQALPCAFWLPFVPASMKNSQVARSFRTGFTQIDYSTEAKQELRWLRRFLSVGMDRPLDDECGQYRFDYAIYRTNPKTAKAKPAHRNPRRGDPSNVVHIVLDAISRREVWRTAGGVKQKVEEPGFIWADDHQVTEGGWREFFGAPSAGFAARIELRDWDGYGWSEPGLWGDS